MIDPEVLGGIITGCFCFIIAAFKIGYDSGIRKQKQHSKDMIEIKTFLNNHIRLTHSLYISIKKLLNPLEINKNDICNFIINYIKVYNNINDIFINSELFEKYMEHDYKSLDNSLKKIINFENLYLNDQILLSITLLINRDIFDVNILQSMKELSEIEEYILNIKKNQTIFNSNLENLLDIIEHKYSILEKYSEFIINMPKINEIELENK